eukprot:164167-Amphidinium_carterae.1
MEGKLFEARSNTNNQRRTMTPSPDLETKRRRGEGKRRAVKRPFLPMSTMDVENFHGSYARDIKL